MPYLKSKNDALILSGTGVDLAVDVSHGPRDAPADGHSVVQGQPVPPHSCNNRYIFVSGIGNDLSVHELEIISKFMHSH